MRELALDPTPAEKLDAVWTRSERVAGRLEEALDWIEADPPDVRAKRRRFSNGLWVIAVREAGEDWTILWEDVEGGPVVRLIDETTSI